MMVSKDRLANGQWPMVNFDAFLKTSMATNEAVDPDGRQIIYDAVRSVLAGHGTEVGFA